MGPAEKFAHYEIARGADGLPIELPRSPDERVFLAFDTRIKRLIELHVLKAGERLRPGEKRSAYERARMAADLGGDVFLHILDCGEDADVLYYASELNDGEWLEDYVARRGALPQATAFGLAVQLLEELITLSHSPRLLSGVRLDRLLVTLQEETFLRLRVVDFGLSSAERHLDGEMVRRHLVHEVCVVLFIMLTGKSFAGDDCDRLPVLTGLPSGLRVAIRTSLANPDNAPSSLERMRDDVRDAFGSQTRDLQGRASRRHLVAADSLLPKSSLREVLLHDVELDRLLKGRLLPEGEGGHLRYPFTFLATDARTEAPLTVHFLPPRRIVANEHYDAVPLQMWRFNADKHPNILRSLSVWESPDLTFLTEERGPGFPLSRLIAERLFLNPPEVLLILRQVKRALDQGQECGVERLDLHPSNIVLRLSGTPPGREMERLLQKRLDAWPRFVVMVRPHMTMRGLYEPMLVEDGATAQGVFDDGRDYRARSYIALAAFLICGGKQTARRATFPDSVPDALAAFLNDCLEKSRTPGRAPSPQDFLAGMEKLASVPEAGGEGGAIALPARGKTLRTVSSSEPMDSAGSVSDFDEIPERPAPVRRAASPSGSLPKGSVFGTQQGIKDHRVTRKIHGRVGLILWAAVVGMLLVIVWSVFSARSGKASRNTAPSSTTGAPANTKRSKAALTPEEIRRALLPSEQEKEQLRREQRRETTGGTGLLVRDEDVIPPKT